MTTTSYADGRVWSGVSCDGEPSKGVALSEQMSMCSGGLTIRLHLHCALAPWGGHNK